MNVPTIVDVRCRLFSSMTDGPSSTHANPLRAWSGPGSSESSYRFVEWLVVEVELSNGVVGIGNAALAPRVARQIVLDHLKPVVVGSRVMDREAIWQLMFRSIIALGRDGAVMAAVSAIDIAIWDATGIELGVPVYDLLGGLKHPSIQVYASQLYPSDDLDALAAEASSYVEDGFTMVKQRLLCGPQEGVQGMNANVELVRVVREAIGPNIDLAADVYMGWDLDYATRMVRLLEPFGLRWLEEPLLPNDRHGYRALRKRSGIPIAAGEHEATLHGIADLVQSGAVDIIQPDVNRVGGLTVAQKVCAIAEASGVPVVPHAGQVHNYHLVAACAGAVLAEYFPISPRPLVGNEMPHLIFRGEPVASRGMVTLPDTPGLGIEIAPKMPVREVR